MKIILAFSLLITFNTWAQSELVFNKRFVESEDKWIALRGKADEPYTYGFVYVDPQAGFTLQLGGSFKVDENKKYISSPSENNVKVRLQANQVQVAIIPQAKLAELGVTAVPDWLKNYKGDTTTVAHLYRWGFTYNAWDYPSGAVRFLQKAYQLDPTFDNLGLELGYTYSALGNYNKAVEVLRSSQAFASDKCYFYKELSYAEIHDSQLDAGAATSKAGIALCDKNEMKSEMAYNVAAQYFLIKDKNKFNIWANETEKWAIKNDKFMINLDNMKRAMQ